LHNPLSLWKEALLVLWAYGGKDSEFELEDSKLRGLRRRQIIQKLTPLLWTKVVSSPMPSTYNLRSRNATSFTQDEVAAVKTLVALRYSSLSSSVPAVQYNTRSVAQATRERTNASTNTVANSSAARVSSCSTVASRVKKNPRFARVDYSECDE
jgi:hypothetical protein